MSDYDLTIHRNPDAQTWAEFFIQTTKSMDRDVFRDKEYMTGWFANSMMAMHDHLLGIKFINGDHMAQELKEMNNKNV